MRASWTPTGVSDLEQGNEGTGEDITLFPKSKDGRDGLVTEALLVKKVTTNPTQASPRQAVGQAWGFQHLNSPRGDIVK